MKVWGILARLSFTLFLVPGALGSVNLTQGEHELDIRVIWKSKESAGTWAGIDCLQLKARQ